MTNLSCSINTRGLLILLMVVAQVSLLKLSFRPVDSFCMKLSSTPASKMNISESPGESHVEPEGSSTSNEPITQPDLQASNVEFLFMLTINDTVAVDR